ncbi:MAG TPA: hypothetical protein VFP44_12240 [Usitatibacter sp.]|nr:hypothetical protein [Usitatibacter sp.]
MKRGINWLQLMIAALVAVLGLILAIRTEGLSRPRQQIALLGGFLMIVIATAAFEAYARRSLDRESRLLEPVGRAVARTIMNTVSLAWLLAAGFLLYVVASGRSSTAFQVAIGALFAAALLAGWWLKRYLRMDSLLPYAITTIVAMMSLALYVIWK